MEKKKQLILLVLKILETESDSRNPLTQTQIAKTISEVYSCDRKTVGRNIKFLKDLGYPIVKTTTGFYMDNKLFSAEEIEFIKSAILKADDKNGIEKKELAEKVCGHISSRYL